MPTESLYTMYESFEMYFPILAERVISYHSNERHELIVKMDDGTSAVYDYVDKELRFLPSNPNNMTKMEFSKEFGFRLRKKLKRVGITQSELCDIVGISQPQLSEYINGKKVPSFYIIDKIAKALNCSVEEFRYTE